MADEPVTHWLWPAMVCMFGSIDTLLRPIATAHELNELFFCNPDTFDDIVNCDRLYLAVLNA